MDAIRIRIRQAQRLCLLCPVVIAPLLVWTGVLLNADAKHFAVRTLTVALCALLAAGVALGDYDAALSRCDHLERIGYDPVAAQALRRAILERKPGDGQGPGVPAGPRGNAP